MAINHNAQGVRTSWSWGVPATAVPLPLALLQCVVQMIHVALHAGFAASPRR